MSVITVTAENFDQVIHSGKPVLLDFFATWCGPCRMVSPIVDQIAEENPQYTVGKIDVDANIDLAKKFGVVNIPTLIVMKNGEIVDKAIGARTKASILGMLEG